MVGVLGQEGEEVEFLRGEIFLFPINPDAAGGFVNL